MNIEGLLTIAGITVAVYAIAQPVQRRSIGLFVPVWLVPTALLFSGAVLIWQKGADVFGYELCPWSEFISFLMAFCLPVVSILVCIYLWHGAKLSNCINDRFNAFLLSCLHENKFDELIRILERNEGRLANILTPANLDLLFETRFVQAMSKARTWLHLQLLSDDELRKKLPDICRSIDSVMRVLISEPTSPLCAAVAASYGTDERPFCSDDDWQLLEKTIENPSWYIGVRADYPLVMIACERLDSGKLDKSYNENDEIYIAHQGRSTRTQCPVFLAIKTHVLMLKQAIKAKNDQDFYVSDLYDIFRTVCDHSIYAPEVWENPRANNEFPTPFAFLMSEVLSDLSFLSNDHYFHGKSPPGRLGQDLVSMWAFCLLLIADSKGKVSKSFKIRSLVHYMDYGLQMRWDHIHETIDNLRKTNCESWSKIFVDALSKSISPTNGVREILLKAANALDICKDHVRENHKWLREQLDLPDRPAPTS